MLIPGEPHGQALAQFLTVDALRQLREFVPRTRQEFLDHAQAVYNLKLATSFPLVLHIEPTNICNQRCIMCQHPSMRREARHIDEQLAIQAIDEFAASEMGWFLHFFFFGEPFLNKRTMDYMLYARRKGVRNLSTTTNFTAVSDDVIRALVDHQIESIHVSFEGLNRERYRVIRQTDHYEAVRENLTRLLAYRAERGSAKPWVSLTYVRTSETDEEIETFRSEWLPQVNAMHISPQFDYLGRSQLTRAGLVANSARLLGRDPGSRVPCRQLWLRLAVLSNGEIVPCSQNMDGELTLGNLRDRTLREAWTGPELARLRMWHISDQFPPDCVCSACTDWDWAGKVDNRPILRPEPSEASPVHP